MKTRLSFLFSFLTAVSLSAGLALQSHAQDNRLNLVSAALESSAEAPLAGVYVHGDYAFVGGHSDGYRTNNNIGVRIVDLSDPSNPELVGRIPLRTRGFSESHSHGDAVAAHLSTDNFQGDVAIVVDGVPDSFAPTDYPEPFGIWDVTDPGNPVFLSVLNLGKAPQGNEGGDLGDKPYDAKEVAGTYFYALYDGQARTGRNNGNPDSRFAAVDISDPRNPVIVGDWQDDREVWLFGLTLNERATRAYITGLTPPPFGNASTQGYLYILDIQDPSQPAEIGRYTFSLRGHPSSPWIARPTSDDAHVVLADGSWGQKTGSSGCGILHILDTSDPAAIHKISEFTLSESSSRSRCSNNPFFFATDVAIRENTVYSSWMGGGVRAIDISDPANPLEVGRFIAPGRSLSDVACLGDHYVVATKIWGSGLYVLRDDAAISTNIEAETTVPAQYALGQNYPNPFNPQTSIHYELPVRSLVSLSVFNLTGQQVATLVEGVREAGAYTVRWNGRDDDGRELAGGVYLYRLRTGDGKPMETRKLVLVR